MIDARFFITVFDGAPSADVIPVSLFRRGIEGEAATEGSNPPFIVTRGHKSINIKFYCMSCQRSHVFRYKLRTLTKKGGNYVNCPSCKLDLGFLGSEKDVQEVAHRHRQEVAVLIKEMGFENFFKDPFVIYDLINHIHDMAENKKLRCQCGSHDIYAGLDFDKIELVCKKCHSSIFISASSREDLDALKSLDYLVISSKGNKLMKYCLRLI